MSATLSTLLVQPVQEYLNALSSCVVFCSVSREHKQQSRLPSLENKVRKNGLQKAFHLPAPTYRPRKKVFGWGFSGTKTPFPDARFLAQGFDQSWASITNSDDGPVTRTVGSFTGHQSNPTLPVDYCGGPSRFYVGHGQRGRKNLVHQRRAGSPHSLIMTAAQTPDDSNINRRATGDGAVSNHRSDIVRTW